jgi:hypothetical protein
MINYLSFKKKRWGKKEKAAYQPSTEEQRVWEEGMQNFKRKNDYCVKKGGEKSLGCLARQVWWCTRVEPEMCDWEMTL